jgi:amino acid transporter
MSTDPGAGGGPPTAAHQLSEDEQMLHKLGYAQELLRGWGGFSNFAISFTIISILAGCLTSYYIAIVWGGPVAVTWGWLLVGGFCILVALAMGEIASTYPTAGGLYYWSSRLGSPGWGWFTGWFNFLGQVAVTAAIDFGAATFISSLLNLWFSFSLTKQHVFIVYTVIIVLHGLINTFGVRLLAMINNISAWWHMGGVLVIVLVLIFIPDHHKSVSFVFTDTENFSGFQGHSFANPVFWFVFGIGLLMSQYTITGYDASAHTSEETVDAARNVPKGILRSVYLSGIFGWVMVSAFVIALPSIADGAKQGGNIFPWLMEQVLPGTFGKILWIGIVVSNFLCGLACVTSTSRMIYAFARDGGLPASSALRKVSPKWKTPVAAIWTTAVLALASTLYAPAYSTLTTACVIFLYISYVMPTAAGFFTFGKSWTKMGPFNIGATAFKSLAVVSVLGVLALVWIGIQPPNDKALTVTLVTIGLLVATWWLGVRKSFRGPPVMSAASTVSPADGALPEPQFVGK